MSVYEWIETHVGEDGVGVDETKMRRKSNVDFLMEPLLIGFVKSDLGVRFSRDNQ